MNKIILCALVLLTLVNRSFADEPQADERADPTFVSLLLGGRLGSEGSKSAFVFDYGLRLGGEVIEILNSKLFFAVSYDRGSQTFTNVLPYAFSTTYNDINIQILLMHIEGTGFYAGPNVGGIVYEDSSTPNGAGDAVTGDRSFEVGAQAGYEYPVWGKLSVGPEIRYEHMTSATSPNNFFIVNAVGTWRF